MKKKTATKETAAKKTAAKSAASHVLFAPPQRGVGQTYYAPSAGGELPEAWWELREPPDLPTGALVFIDEPDRGYASLLAKRPPALLPLRSLGQLVVNADLAKALGELPGVDVCATLLRDTKNKEAKGYSLLDIVRHVPLDRKASRARYERGWLAELSLASWRDGVPLPPMFRLLDRPMLVFVRSDLADVLAKAAPRGACAIDDYANATGGVVADKFPPEWSRGGLPELAAGNDAEDAFWAHFSGDRQARGRALSHPWWAYAVALSVDGKPADDTRIAAAASPIIAALYASNVERAGHEVTRKAANANGLSALRYATHVDYALDPSLRPLVLRDAGHDESTLPGVEENLAALRAWLSGR